VNANTLPGHEQERIAGWINKMMVILTPKGQLVVEIYSFSTGKILAYMILVRI
jgi:hypothetical protein